MAIPFVLCVGKVIHSLAKSSNLFAAIGHWGGGRDIRVINHVICWKEPLFYSLSISIDHRYMFLAI